MIRVRTVLALALGLVLGAAVSQASPRPVDPVSRTLANGMRVVVFTRPGLGVVQSQLQVEGGSAFEPEGHAGIAMLTAQMLRLGTTSRSAAGFAAELDTLGASFAVNVTRDAGQVAVGSRREEFEAALELLSDAVVNPRFDEQAFLATRRQLAVQLGQQTQDLGLLADERVASLVFASHPYARSPLGDLRSLLGGSVEQVRAFHRARWRPDRAVLVVSGDLAPEAAFAAANEWFGRWAGRAESLPAARPLPQRTGVWLFDAPGAPVAEVRAAVVTPGRGDASWPAWIVAHQLLEDTLPAGLRATLVPGREAGLLTVSATARLDSVGVAATRVRDALLRLESSPSSVATARRHALGRWAMSLETVGQWSSSWLAGSIAGLGEGHLGATAMRLREADPAPALARLQRGCALLVVAPGERVRSRLAPLGPVQPLAVETALASADSTSLTDQQRSDGRRHIAAALQAHGGLEKLTAASSNLVQGTLEMSANGQRLEGELRLLRSGPDRFVKVTRLLELEIRQVLDRERGWTLSTFGDSAWLTPADSTTLLSLRAELASDFIHLLRDASLPTADAGAVGSETIAGRKVDLVEFRTPLGMRTRLLLDAVSHRVVGADGVPTPQGVWRDRRLWSDPVQVDGVWWPRQEVRLVDGEEVARMVLRSIQPAPEVDPTLFKRPLVVRGQVRGVLD